ncbi:MAG: hypothetical protein U9Q33_12545, partial [Campylobacterota bacterium]|nr:hypothetical protein [Campylobacterota bacterium]
LITTNPLIKTKTVEEIVSKNLVKLNRSDKNIINKQIIDQYKTKVELNTNKLLKDNTNLEKIRKVYQNMMHKPLSDLDMFNQLSDTVFIGSDNITSNIEQNSNVYISDHRKKNIIDLNDSNDADILDSENISFINSKYLKKQYDKKLETKVDTTIKERFNENFTNEHTNQFDVIVNDFEDRIDELAVKIFNEIKDEIDLGFKRL